MDRRSFLKTSALGGTAAAATTLAAPAYAQGKRTLTMVTSWPRGFAVLDDAATYLNNMVNEMSDGTLTIDKKAPGELVGAFEVFDAVSSGQADMYHSADYYFIGQHPAYAYYTAVPFGGTAQELTNWYYHGGGHDLHNELGEIFNLKSSRRVTPGLSPVAGSARKSHPLQTSTVSSSVCLAWVARFWVNWAHLFRTSPVVNCIRRCLPVLWTVLSGLVLSRTNARASRKLRKYTTQRASTSQAPVFLLL